MSNYIPGWGSHPSSTHQEETMPQEEAMLRRIYHWRIIRTHNGVSNTVTLRRDKDDAERAAKQLQVLTQNPNVRYSVEPRE